ncbi:TetR/AcrR family transcriptional regulator [Actinophytocola sp. S1-96]|uniref:TetR/AcrR family transcriptional regulator n=1 Tax=Actinophytocola gossypii TaxID=2812003 RepID=A0ABT2J726_9PSEU|nr:TetR/AcrR family transcriptional regulator [Actinophytocola gossypii]MCT2583656.1 TetR/AcrR family transcriptional regulator [Actinophytocola gossypii]
MVTEVGRRSRSDQSGGTRQLILATAERLFAEQGLYAVSNRQISAAAGQGNNAAVGYHFGTKADLVRAIVRQHTERIEELRAELVARVRGSTNVRDWVVCLVCPVTTHLDRLGDPTWYARFGAQVAADPAFRDIMAEESLATPALREVLDGLGRCLADLPTHARHQRGEMIRLLMVHGCAERERATSPKSTWDDTATGMVDAITGLLTAPVTG